MNTFESATTYPYFEANQVLSSKHLNELRNYLDQQNRQTRVKLIGIGIVCGLDVRVEDAQVYLSGGVGVTSEGYLINVADSVLTRFKPYDDRGNYSLFFKGSGKNKVQHPLWELLEEDSDKKGEDTEEQVANLSDYKDFLDDKVLLLYLEIFDKDIKSCVGETCDDKGKERIYTVRKLVVEKEIAEQIIRQTYTGEEGKEKTLDEIMNHRFSLPNVSVGRFTILNGNQSADKYEAACDQFKNLTEFTNHHIAKVASNHAIDQISGACNYINAFLQPVLTRFGAGYNVNAFEGMNERLKKWRAESKGYIQSFCDYLEDMAAAYDELRMATFELVARCCPPTGLFPRHLMVGELFSMDSCKPTPYRSHFIPAPIHMEQYELKEKIRVLLERLRMMAHGYKNPTELVELRITPSRETNNPISERAIPAYYNMMKSSLHETWSYEKRRMCREDFNLSYHAHGYSDRPEILDPLRYNLDQTNFLRIEGHQGKELGQVMQQLDDYKKRFNIDFDVVHLSLEELAKKRKQAIEEGCDMGGYQEDYLRLRNELINQIKGFQNAFDLYSRFLYSGQSDVTNPYENLVNYIPMCLEDFDFNVFRQKFKESYDEALKFAMTIEIYIIAFLKQNYDVSTKIALITYLVRALAIVDDFLMSNIFSEFQTIVFSKAYGQVEQSLAIEDHLFRNFVKFNRSLHHLSGVKDGDTFILVSSAKVVGGDTNDGEVKDDTGNIKDVVDSVEDDHIKEDYSTVDRIIAKEAAVTGRASIADAAYANKVSYATTADYTKVIRRASDFYIKADQPLDAEGQLSRLKGVIAGTEHDPAKDIDPDVITDDREYRELVVGDFTISGKLPEKGEDCCTCKPCKGNEPLFPPIAKSVHKMVYNDMDQVSIYTLHKAVDVNIKELEISAFDQTSEKGGTVSIAMDNEGKPFFYYSIPPEFIGLDSFNFTVKHKDGYLTDSAKVLVYVLPSTFRWTSSTGGGGQTTGGGAQTHAGAGSYAVATDNMKTSAGDNADSSGPVEGKIDMGAIKDLNENIRVAKAVEGYRVDATSVSVSESNSPDASAPQGLANMKIKYVDAVVNDQKKSELYNNTVILEEQAREKAASDITPEKTEAKATVDAYSKVMNVAAREVVTAENNLSKTADGKVSITESVMNNKMTELEDRNFYSDLYENQVKSVLASAKAEGENLTPKSETYKYVKNDVSNQINMLKGTAVGENVETVIAREIQKEEKTGDNPEYLSMLKTVAVNTTRK